MNNLIESNHATLMPNVGQEVEKTRALQEVQAAIFMARQLPRDETRAYRKVLEAAKRLSLAEKAIYCYPRGGQQIKGPSIRTAETIAKYWGNLSYGIKELSQSNTEHSSEMMAYCWDLENNVRVERIFKVPHIRDTKQGPKLLTDARDIYEKTANDGARRLRAVILEVLPSDVVEDFITECEKTLVGSNTKPLKDRVQDMLKLFEELGVTKEMIEQRVGTKTDNFIAKNIVDLGAVYNSIKNNFAPVEQYFEMPTAAEKQKEETEAKLKAAGKDGKSGSEAADKNLGTSTNAGKDGKKKQYEPTPEELAQLEEIYGVRNEAE